ncbi:DUF1513 domain-containing protein [Actinomadura sp. 7K534]|nr:DUF1513 domain-containing protein [Actinomadura sp. 7K534]
MVARSEGKKIRLSDVAEKRTARFLSGHIESVGSVAFSQDGKLLASSSTLSDTVRIWDVASGRSLRDIPSEPLAIFADDLAFTPDGRTLAKSNDDNSIQLWGRRQRQADRNPHQRGGRQLLLPGLQPRREVPRRQHRRERYPAVGRPKRPRNHDPVQP